MTSSFILLLLLGHNFIDVQAKVTTTSGGLKPRTTTNTIVKSSSKSTYKPTKISYSSRSTYAISPYSYYIFLFPAVYIPYLSLTYPDVDIHEYCKLTGCQYTENNTNILSTPKGNFDTQTFLADIGNETNITALNTKITNNYGCNLDFGGCMTGSSTKIIYNYTLTMFLIALVVYLCF